MQSTDVCLDAMLNGMKIGFHKKCDACISFSRSNDPESSIAVYTGFCKTKSNIEDMMENNVDHVLVYNHREINMLDTLGTKYLLKIKLHSQDIGIHISNLQDVLNYNLTNLVGIYLPLTKSTIRDSFLSKNRFVGEYSVELFGNMRNVVFGLLNSLHDKGVDLRIMAIDIRGYDNEPDNENESNVMFKLSVYNYIKNVLAYSSCSVL